MSTREIAMDILSALSEEQLEAFVTVFGNENLKAIAESNRISNDDTRPRYDSFEEIEKVIFENE